MAKQLIARRNTVIITGRNREKLQEAKSHLPGVHIFQSDASKVEDIQSLRQNIVAEFPALDTLFNNAGIITFTLHGVKDLVQHVVADSRHQFVEPGLP